MRFGLENKKVSVLIVEDESLVGHDIANKVQQFGYKVSKICSKGIDAINYIKNNSISLILMDINIKGDIDGIETIKKISVYKEIPVIYITAYIDDITIARAVETNPSAYLVKPFNEQELKASMKIALTKQYEDKSNDNLLLDEEFSFNLQNRQLYHKGEFIKLTNKETQLLMLLIQRKNQIVPIDVIEIEIWPDKVPNDNTRRALISRLRAKLKHKFIDTHSALGYMMKF